ncbi:MAG: hypothetical protein JSW54_05190, partial [Fidelibacterota bacterium]
MRKANLLKVLAGLILGLTQLQAGEITFDLATGLFRGPGGLSRLEVYLGIDREQITFEQSRGRYSAHLAGVVLVKRHGQIVDFTELSIDDEVQSLEYSSVGTIAHQTAFTLAPGRYEMQVVLEDRQGNQSERSMEIQIPPIQELELAVSTIELAALIRRSGGPKDFLKKGLAVWPNAGAVYHDRQPLLWYYAEIYGLTPLDTVEISSTISGQDGAVVAQTSKRTPSPSLVLQEWGALNLSLLDTGDYRLGLTATVNGATTSAATWFRVDRDSVAPPDTGDILA